MFGRRLRWKVLVLAPLCTCLLQLKHYSNGEWNLQSTLSFTRMNSTTTASSVDVFSSSCETTNSLQQVALKSAHLSSPPGSASYNKTLRVLRSAKEFSIDFGDRIFVNVIQNLHQMLQPMGLTPLKTPLQDPEDPRRNETIRIIVSFHGINQHGGCVNRQNNTSCLADMAGPRIILQTEQMSALGAKYRNYLTHCHESPLCVIWDYSDSHLHWAKQAGIAESVMLLPIMHQSRMGRDIGDKPQPRALLNRSLDVAFFGLITGRRGGIRQAGLDRNWTMRVEKSKNLNLMKASYNDARICLIIHSYTTGGAAEFHRLVELATAGCVPIMESIDDEFAMDTYNRCGGLILTASYSDIIPTVQDVLDQIKNGTLEYNERQVEWWRRGIDWESLLTSIYQRELDTVNTESSSSG